MEASFYKRIVAVTNGGGSSYFRFVSQPASHNNNNFSTEKFYLFYFMKIYPFGSLKWKINDTKFG